MNRRIPTSSANLYGAENCTLQKVDQKYLDGFETGTGEGWKRSVEPIVCEMKKYHKE
jgi:hypothetical protein